MNAISRHRPASFLCLAFLAPLSLNLSAQTWNGSASKFWSTAANWTPSGVPAAGADISVLGPTPPIAMWLDVDRSIGLFDFGTRTAAFEIQTRPDRTLSIAGGVTAGGAFGDTTNLLNFRGNVHWIAAQSLHVGGNDGDSEGADRGVRFRPAEDEVTPGTLYLNADLTKTGSGQLQLIGTTLSGPGNLILNTGTLKLNAGSGLPLDLLGPGNLTFNNSSRLVTSRNSGSFGNVTRPIVMAGTSSWVHTVGQGGQNEFMSPVSWQDSPHELSAERLLVLGGAWSGAATVEKSGIGTVVLAGSSPAYSGTLSSVAGAHDRLRVEAPFGGHVTVNGGSVTINATVSGNVVASGSTATVNLKGQSSAALVGGNLTATSAMLAGEPLITGNISLNAAKLSVNPETGDAWIRANGDVTLSGATEVTLRGSPISGQPFAILEYGGSLALGSGGTLANRLQLAGGNSNYRGTPTFSVNGTNPKRIDLNVTTGNLTWTGGSSSTWSTGATGNWSGTSPQQFRHLDNVTFNDSTTRSAIALSGTLHPGVVTFENTTARAFSFTSSSASNCISGGARIVKNGNGTVTLGGGDNQDFTGTIEVNAGVLKMGSNAAFGKSPEIRIRPGGQVDFDGMKPASAGSGDFVFRIEGSGPDAQGALVNSRSINSGTPPGSDAGIRSLILDGDAMISSRGRYDVGFDTRGGRGLMTGNNHLLTVATDSFNVDGTTDGRRGMAFMGSAAHSPIRIRIAQGAAWAQDCDHAFGGSDSSLTIAGGARAGTFGDLTIPVKVVIENGGMLHSQGGPISGTSRWTGGLTLEGNADVHSGGHRIEIAGTISQASGVIATLTKKGNGILGITGDSSYTGQTAVEQGTLLVNGVHGKSGLAPVTVNNSSTLGGTGRIMGQVTITQNATVSPGEVLLSAASGAADITGSLRIGHLLLEGTYRFEIDRWTGVSAVDWDLIQADSLQFGTNPVIDIPTKPGDFIESGRTFVIATSASPISGFNPGLFTIVSFPETNSNWTLELSGDNKSLLLRYGAGGATTYDSWSIAAGLAGSAALGVNDPDGDGFNNFEEFLFGTSPIVFTGALVDVAQIGAIFEVRWLQRSSGNTYNPQQSTTLAEGSWTTISSGGGITLGDDPASAGTPSGHTRRLLTFTLPTTGPRRFVRIVGN